MLDRRLPKDRVTKIEVIVESFRVQFEIAVINYVIDIVTRDSFLLVIKDWLRSQPISFKRIHSYPFFCDQGVSSSARRRSSSASLSSSRRYEARSSRRRYCHLASVSSPTTSPGARSFPRPQPQEAVYPFGNRLGNPSRRQIFLVVDLDTPARWRSSCIPHVVCRHRADGDSGDASRGVRRGDRERDANRNAAGIVSS